MLTARRTALLALAAAVLLTGCWNPFSPDEEEGGQDQVYHEFCDSAYKVLENLELAYKSMDLDHYLMCFTEDFEFFLLETDWADYDGDGQTDQSWGLDLEEQFHEVLFEGGGLDAPLTRTVTIRDENVKLDVVEDRGVVTLASHAPEPAPEAGAVLDFLPVVPMEDLPDDEDDAETDLLLA